MKTVKTRNNVRGIKVLDRSVNLSKRMKDATIRTKEKAEETKDPRHATPTEYATDNVSGTAQGAARETAHHLPTPNRINHARRKASENWDKAKGHFQEVKNQMPKARQRAAEQAQQTAKTVKTKAETLQKTADQAKTTANEAKTAVRDAKSNLKRVRQEGRQTLREIKQGARIERGVETPRPVDSGIKTRNSVMQQAETPAKANPGRERFIKGRQRDAAPNNAHGAGRENITPKGGGQHDAVHANNAPKAETPRAQSGASKLQRERGIKRLKQQRTAKPAQGNAPPQKPPSTSGGKPVSVNAPKEAITRPGYMNSGVKAAKGANPAKPLDKTAKAVKSTKKGVKKTAKGTIKTAKKSVKTAEKSAKAAVKTAKQTAKTAQKTAQTTAKVAKVAAQASKAAAKAAVAAAKAATKAIIALVKATIAAIKGLIAAIAAGGWVAVVIILIICLIGLLVGSIFGIFFSGEDTGTGRSMPTVVAELTAEFYEQIEQIKSDNPHDILDEDAISIYWPEVLAVYAVKVTTDPDGMDVVTLDDDRVDKLRGVLHDMVTLSYTTRTDTWSYTVTNDEGEEETVTETIVTLIITLTQKSVDDMAALYGFNNEQKTQLAELLSPEYADLWAELLGGYVMGDGTIYIYSGSRIPNNIFSWPFESDYPITSGFGYRKDPFTGEIKFHGGIDLGVPAGVPILAAADGTVIDANSTDSWGGGYGYYVKIQHDGGYVTVYAHCSQIAVVNGQAVMKGQVVGYVGSTGKSTGNHLHWEVWKNGERTDPLGYFG